MYCDMERSCNGVAGGWMRVASIDMTGSNDTCPPGLNTIVEDSHTLCARNTDTGCSSTVFPVCGVQYSRVCGKIIGYQQKSPDAFFRFISGQNTIDTNYVDGISLTHGSNPREHVWTFAAALQEDISSPPYHTFLCPCKHQQQHLHSLDKATSVTQAIQISSSSSSMEMILSGMVQVVVNSTPAVP